MLVKGTYFYRSHWYVFIFYVKKTDNHNNKSNFFIDFPRRANKTAEKD